MFRIPSRDEIIRANKPKLHAEPTPELGEGTGVYIREFSGKVREEFGNAVPEMTTQGQLHRYACVFGLCDESGSPIFTLADVDALADLVPGLFDRLGKRCAEINATNKKAVDDEKKS